jgi:hypothetical protein
MDGTVQDDDLYGRTKNELGHGWDGFSGLLMDAVTMYVCMSGSLAHWRVVYIMDTRIAWIAWTAWIAMDCMDGWMDGLGEQQVLDANCSLHFPQVYS